MTISVSTLALSSRMPSSACAARRLPSKTNGLVTTPTSGAQLLRHAAPTTGAAPVPVPPPMPAVMNTMSAPLEVLAQALDVLQRRRAPTSGLPPAPSPA